MSGHTPGPWNVTPNPMRDDGFFITHGPSDRDYKGQIPAAIVPTQLTNLADALLIAAAPDLLEAAKLTALHFKRSLASGNFQGDDEHEAWTALQKAIDKATGSPVDG